MVVWLCQGILDDLANVLYQIECLILQVWRKSLGLRQGIVVGLPLLLEELQHGARGIDNSKIKE